MRGSKVAILDFMRKRNGITSMQAFEHLGVTRLSARIKELRDAGYNIVTQECIGKTRFDEVCRYARYVLIEEDK